MYAFHIITPYSHWSNKKTKQQELRERQDEEALLAKLMCEAQQQQNSTNGEATAVGANFSDYKFFNPVLNASLGATPLTGDGPLTVTFTNNSDPSLVKYGTFVLTFGDNGFISTNPDISYLYSNTGSYTASLVATANYNGAVATAVPVYISSSKPTVTSGFTYSTRFSVWLKTTMALSLPNENPNLSESNVISKGSFCICSHPSFVANSP